MHLLTYTCVTETDDSVSANITNTVLLGGSNFREFSNTSHTLRDGVSHGIVYRGAAAYRA